MDSGTSLRLIPLDREPATCLSPVPGIELILVVTLAMPTNDHRAIQVTMALPEGNGQGPVGDLRKSYLNDDGVVLIGQPY